MNAGELVSELTSLLGNRSTNAIASARYYLWLNNTEIELASAFQFFQIEKIVTAPMVVGQSRYSLPTDLLAIYSLRDTTKKRKISRSHYRKFDNLDLSTSGDPSHYVRFGAYFELTPLPNATNTMQLRYAKNLTPMTVAASEPSLPVPWHEIILLGAEMRGWKALGEVKRRLDAKNEYLALVKSRRSEWEIEDSDEEFGVELMR